VEAATIRFTQNNHQTLIFTGKSDFSAKSMRAFYPDREAIKVAASAPPLARVGYEDIASP